MNIDLALECGGLTPLCAPRLDGAREDQTGGEERRQAAALQSGEERCHEQF